jgi:hypothetical protein
MPKNVSDRLQAALERLDQAIDRLDARVSDHLEREDLRSASPMSASPIVVEKLDRIIKRIELALAE